MAVPTFPSTFEFESSPKIIREYSAIIAPTPPALCSFPEIFVDPKKLTFKNKFVIPVYCCPPGPLKNIANPEASALLEVQEVPLKLK